PPPPTLFPYTTLFRSRTRPLPKAVRPSCPRRTRIERDFENSKLPRAKQRPPRPSRRWSEPGVLEPAERCPVARMMWLGSWGAMGDCAHSSLEYLQKTPGSLALV